MRENINRRRREKHALRTQAEKDRLSSITSHNRRLRREKLRNTINSIKLKHGGKCQLCGYDKNLVALTWHHTADKEHTIADLISQAQITKAIEETQKCILICANCHIILHYEDR